MTTTPRTDELANKWCRGGGFDWIEFARELETALSALTEENKELLAKQDKMMLQSVGAMAIAEGQEGYEKVPIDCPMLGAVLALREDRDDWKHVSSEWQYRAEAGELKKQLGHTTEPSEAMCGPPTDDAKNAQRYRLLRDHNEERCDNEQPFVAIHTQNSWGKWYDRIPAPEELDAAIDTLLAARTPETSPAVESTEKGFDCPSCHGKGFTPHTGEYENEYLIDGQRMRLCALCQGQSMSAGELKRVRSPAVAFYCQAGGCETQCMNCAESTLNDWDSVIEECAKICDEIAKVKVAQEGSFKRDPYVYEQGIGAEQCSQAIRSMKSEGQ